MIKGLYTAEAGMRPKLARMEILANNLANINTTGFKRGRAEFQDLFSETLRNAQQSLIQSAPASIAAAATLAL